MAMGSPLSPILAEIVTDSLIKTTLTALNIEIRVIKKYVDDLFLCVPAESVDEVLYAFNNYHPKLQFTVETEQNRQLPFLDMVVVRNEDQTFATDWYQKPIASGRFLNYHSAHPIHMKTNIAYNFIKRVTEMSTTRTAEQKRQTIIKQLQLNDYPRALINRMINRRQRTPTHSEEPDDHDVIYKSIPYIDKLTPKINKLIKQSGHFENIKISNYNVNTLDHWYATMKGKTEKSQRSNVIYCLQCSQCEAKYVGLTTNKLKTRLYGHKSDKNKLDKIRAIEDENLKNIQLDHWKERTAIMQHSVETGHTFNYDSATILDSSNKSNRLPILEICHIMTTKNINKRSDTEGLSISYTGIMHTLKKRNNKHNTNCNRTSTTQTQIQNHS